MVTLNPLKGVIIYFEYNSNMQYKFQYGLNTIFYYFMKNISSS